MAARSESLGHGVELHTLVVGPMENNAYLLTTEDDAVLVDAAAEPGRLLELVAGRRVSTIITTHRHADHIGALAEVATATGARLVCGADDRDAVAAATGTDPSPLTEADEVPLGRHRLGVVELVGHTPGSITLVLALPSRPVHLLTGDSLFPGGPGKTWSPEDFTRLMDDLEAKVFARFDDATVVHPGHGEPTTLGRERPSLGEWRARGW
ncbi:MBL fold metallo-hydrolase [Desertihabitans brevis]|uniref:MBL fold metallo-hydrolase n=1 Tax=Desertihabitans brevis TaxID=2268447 RepID=A0A367YXF2_9ACTN|nr:MBL fold metallo-hydrolase [Desertihabitans brevis]RCK70583.1 MBL fold metallo-hydrolase [Desertihabitans brevis]